MQVGPQAQKFVREIESIIHDIKNYPQAPATLTQIEVSNSTTGVHDTQININGRKMERARNQIKSLEKDIKTWSKHNKIEE